MSAPRIFSVPAFRFSLVDPMSAIGKWSRVATFGPKAKDGARMVFDATTLGQMVDNAAARGDRIAICNDHASAYPETRDAPALGFFYALAVVAGGRVVKHWAMDGGAKPDASTMEDGLYARLGEVTPRGADPIVGLANYRTLSPMFTENGKGENDEDIGFSLFDVAATNVPFQGGAEIMFHGAPSGHAIVGLGGADIMFHGAPVTHAMARESRGHIAWLDNGMREAYDQSGEVYIAPANAPIDLDGYRQGGRWECSRGLWDRSIGKQYKTSPSSAFAAPVAMATSPGDRFKTPHGGAFVVDRIGQDESKLPTVVLRNERTGAEAIYSAKQWAYQIGSGNFVKMAAWDLHPKVGSRVSSGSLTGEVARIDGDNFIVHWDNGSTATYDDDAIERGVIRVTRFDKGAQTMAGTVTREQDAMIAEARRLAEKSSALDMHIGNAILIEISRGWKSGDMVSALQAAARELDSFKPVVGYSDQADAAKAKELAREARALADKAARTMAWFPVGPPVMSDDDKKKIGTTVTCSHCGRPHKIGQADAEAGNAYCDNCGSRVMSAAPQTMASGQIVDCDYCSQAVPLDASGNMRRHAPMPGGFDDGAVKGVCDGSGKGTGAYRAHQGDPSARLLNAAAPQTMANDSQGAPLAVGDRVKGAGTSGRGEGVIVGISESAGILTVKWDSLPGVYDAAYANKVQKMSTGAARAFGEKIMNPELMQKMGLADGAPIGDKMAKYSAHAMSEASDDEIKAMADDLDASEDEKAKAMAAKFRRMAGPVSDEPVAMDQTHPINTAKGQAQNAAIHIKTGNVNDEGGRKHSRMSAADDPRIVAMNATIEALNAKVGYLQAEAADRARQAEANRNAEIDQMVADAVAGGYPAAHRSDLVRFARVDFEAALGTVQPFLKSSANLFSRTPRTAAGRSTAVADAVEKNVNGVRVVKFGNQLAAAAKARATADKISYDRALDIVVAEKPELYEAVINARR